MAVATSNLSQKSKFPGKTDNAEQKYLQKLARNATGVTSIVTVAENGANSTTPTSTNLRVNGLKAGQRYKVNGIVRIINATVGNGGRCEFNLTGTQTTAVFAGAVMVTTALTTPTLIPAVAATTGHSAARFGNGVDYGATGTGAGDSAVNITVDGFIIPQNDGDLIVAVGSGANTTFPTLQVGSFLTVTKLEF